MNKSMMHTLFKWSALFAFVVVFGKPILAAISQILTTVSAKLP